MTYDAEEKIVSFALEVFAPFSDSKSFHASLNPGYQVHVNSLSGDVYMITANRDSVRRKIISMH